MKQKYKLTRNDYYNFACIIKELDCERHDLELKTDNGLYILLDFTPITSYYIDNESGFRSIEDIELVVHSVVVCTEEGKDVEHDFDKTRLTEYILKKV